MECIYTSQVGCGDEVSYCHVLQEQRLKTTGPSHTFSPQGIFKVKALILRLDISIIFVCFS